MGITRFQPHSVMHCDRSSPHTKAIAYGTDTVGEIFLSTGNLDFIVKNPRPKLLKLPFQSIRQRYPALRSAQSLCGLQHRRYFTYN
ncbi:MAG: hypothetical protein V7L11_24620 [Nostoc sp.]|uniref:hypothetical protein n=1 Tax=Nostoc sp. TaxID=1180 RepID=UPI002FF6303F